MASAHQIHSALLCITYVDCLAPGAKAFDVVEEQKSA